MADLRWHTRHEKVEGLTPSGAEFLRGLPEGYFTPLPETDIVLLPPGNWLNEVFIHALAEYVELSGPLTLEITDGREQD